MELVDIGFGMIVNTDFVDFDELDDDNIQLLDHIVLGNYYMLGANRFLKQLEKVRFFKSNDLL